MPKSSLGKVFLVGAGPGDPGLISLRAVECLRIADVVLYDGLVNPLLLKHVHATAERTCRTKGPHGSFLNQDEINQRMIRAAEEGKTVVRLKGGDAYIFGHGWEEASALAEAGIPFEVVPGITAVTVASEYAGISLTHRQFTSSIAFVSGYEDPQKDETLIDYANLAEFSGTLVFYMGLHRLQGICEALISEGKPENTPACVISRATTPQQKTVVAPLGELAEKVSSQQLKAPSLILVGKNVAQREQLAWFEKRPLFGLRIGITRPLAQSEELIEKVWNLGARPILIPMIEILPPEDWQEVDRMLERLAEFDWLIFTSSNGVNYFLNRLWSCGFDSRKLANLKIAVVGQSTENALKEYRLRADVVPKDQRAEGLVDALASQVKNHQVLWVRGNHGREVLKDGFIAQGAHVEELTVYRNENCENLTPEHKKMLLDGEIDWIGLSSPAIARNFAKLLPDATFKLLGNKIRLATISPLTTSAAKQAGLTISTEAKNYCWDGILEAIRASSL